ncbi:MAG TPA: hypothetical protein VJ250_04185, partial [Nitrososphaeraceae archaeon]|nr:hypothetical protein [Nitrososphaeraceae archaeon]
HKNPKSSGKILLLSTSRHIHSQIVLTVLVLVCKNRYILNSILKSDSTTITLLSLIVDIQV